MKILCTHDGSFHIDDVMGYVLLRVIYPDHQLTRTRNEVLIQSADIVWDVGGGKYDHHFKNNKPYRDDGIPYSSAGLLWKDFGKDVISSLIDTSLDQYIDQIWTVIDEEIIKVIDMNDNGCLPDSVSNNLTLIRMVSDQNLSWDEEYGREWTAADELRKRFIDVANIMEIFLVSRIKRSAGSFKARKIVMAASERVLPCGIIELPFVMPWNEVIFENDLPVNFVIYPSGKRWRINCVPPEPTSFGQKIPLPEKFAGLTQEELVSVSPFHDLYFVHANRFTAGTGSRDTAIKLCQMAFEEHVATEHGKTDIHTE